MCGVCSGIKNVRTVVGAGVLVRVSFLGVVAE